jgi:hypothetical protein
MCAPVVKINTDAIQSSVATLFLFSWLLASSAKSFNCWQKNRDTHGKAVEWRYRMTGLCAFMFASTSTNVDIQRHGLNYLFYTSCKSKRDDKSKTPDFTLGTSPLQVGLIRICIGATQLEVGTFEPFLFICHSIHGHTTLTASWFHEIWSFIELFEGIITLSNSWIPSPQWQHDQSVMALAIIFTSNKGELRHINMCRIFLRVISVSDITASDETHHAYIIWRHTRRCPSQYQVAQPPSPYKGRAGRVATIPSLRIR